MNWFDYTLLALFVLNALIVVSLVGKPRKPIEAGTATISVSVQLLLIAGLLFSRGVL